MENKKKGLADDQHGEFILNESGSSISTDKIDDKIDPNKTSPDDPSENSMLAGTAAQPKDGTD